MAAQACFGRDTPDAKAPAPQVWRQLKSPHRIVEMAYNDACGTDGGDKVKAPCPCSLLRLVVRVGARVPGRVHTRIIELVCTTTVMRVCRTALRRWLCKRPLVAAEAWHAS